MHNAHLLALAEKCMAMYVYKSTKSLMDISEYPFGLFCVTSFTRGMNVHSGGCNTRGGTLLSELNEQQFLG